MEINEEQDLKLNKADIEKLLQEENPEEVINPFSANFV